MRLARAFQHAGFITEVMQYRPGDGDIVDLPFLAWFFFVFLGCFLLYHSTSLLLKLLDLRFCRLVCYISFWQIGRDEMDL